MTKRNRQNAFARKAPAKTSSLKWEPMANASFGPEGDAQMLAADPHYVGVFKNNQYQAMLREYPYDQNKPTEMVSWLVIRRLDSEAVHDWRHLQCIKNDLCGPEREGLEIYPAESRLVDQSNQFHLFVMPLGVILPFGYQERDVSDATRINGETNKNKQRPFEDPPADLNANTNPAPIVKTFATPAHVVPTETE